MTLTSALMLIVAAAAPAEGAESAATERYAEVTVRRQVIIRVPTRRAPLPQKPVEYKEKKAPRCIPMGSIAGAAVTKPESVDFILKGGTRMRARLESECPALDYYSGFYIAPTEDQRICAGRDAIHARSGGECQISRFRTLIPKDK